MTKRLVALGGVFGILLLGGATCEEGDPCQDYVDYMCDCHADDPEFDCTTLQNTYADADPELQDQCVIDLEDQQQADEDAGICVEPV